MWLVWLRRVRMSVLVGVSWCASVVVVGRAGIRTRVSFLYFCGGLGRLEVGGVGCGVVVLDYVPVGIPELRARG